jgi:hypothetical protein
MYRTDIEQWVNSFHTEKQALLNLISPCGEYFRSGGGSPFNKLLLLGLQGLILGEECSRPKPFPDPYQEGLHLLGLQPHEALVIEDSPAGDRGPGHGLSGTVSCPALTFGGWSTENEGNCGFVFAA